MPGEGQPAMNVLLVEDNEDDIEIVRRILDRSGLKTRLQVVRDGAEAMNMLLCRESGTPTSVTKTSHPDLVLLDLSLPKIDGLEILRRIRADHELGAVPVVVLSGSVAREPVRQCMELGSNLYVLKPMDIADVANIVSGIQKYWGRLGELDQKAA